MSSSLNTSILWTPDGPADGWFGIVTYEIYQAVHAIFLDPNTVTRVIDLEKINEDYPDQPAILIRLAQDYFKLNDPASTYQCAQRAHRLIVERAHQTDPKLAAWVQFLHTKVETHLQEQEAYWDIASLDSVLVPDVTPFEHYQTELVDHSDVTQLWSGASQHLSLATLSIRMARLMSIESSELEGVFKLGGESIGYIVRAGFFLGAIEKIEPSSSIQKKEQIIPVLENYQEALSQWAKYWIRDHTLNSTMVQEVHHALMRSTRLRKDSRGGYTIITTRAWRSRFVYVNSQPRTLFHRPNKVQQSLNRFFDLAAPFIDLARTGNLANAYTVAAWLHHCLISIHPFEDGNGRTIRIISSTVLALCKLPPINVLSRDAGEYYRVLKKADHDLDLRPLAMFLKEQAIKTINVLLNISSTPLSSADTSFDVEMQTQSGDLASMQAPYNTGPITLPE